MKQFFIYLVFVALLCTSTQVFAEPINVNQATLEQLVENLHGIGAHKAQAIIDYREQHGNFDSANDLLNVSGVGQSTLVNNKLLLQFE